MNERPRGHAVAHAALTAFLLLTLESPATAGAATAMLQGRVLGPDDRPVTGTVRVLGAEDASPRVRATDEEGSFEVPVPTDGGYRVRIEAEGLEPIVVEDPPFDRPLVQRLAPGASLEGRVVEENSGEAIEDATVWVCDRDTADFGFDACAKHPADANGHFLLTGVPAGAVRLGASSPNHAYSSVVLEPTRPPDAFHRIDLEPGAPLSGRVVNERGEPVAGARIGRDRFKHPFDERTVAALDPPLLTDAEGEFRHPGIEVRDRWNYRGLLDGWYGAPSDWIVAIQGSPETVELKLQRPAVLQFGLLDEGGEPLEADVRLVHQTLGSPGGPRGRAGEDGRYRFDGMPSSPLELVLTADGYRPIDLGEVPFQPGGTIDLGDLRASRGVRVTGTLRENDGGPIAEGWIDLSYREPVRYGKRFAVEDGEFMLDGVPSGVEVTLRAEAEGYKPAVEARTFETDALWEPTLTPYAVVRGRVLLPGGEPATRFAASVHYQDQPTRSRQAKDFETDDGTFSLWPIQPAGTHTLEISAKGYRDVILTDIVVGERQWVDVGEIELDLGHTVSGVALAPDGSPALGARVAVWVTGTPGVYGSSGIGAEGVADAEGRFSMTGLGPGFFQVDAQHPDFAPWSGDLELVEGVQGGSLTIEFSEGGIVHGFTRDRSSSPVPGIQVGIECPRLPGSRTADTDDQGYYRFRRLPTGQCRVWAFQDDGSPFSNPRLVAVAEQRESRADFDLSTAIEVTGVVRVGGDLAERGFLTFQTAGGFAGSGVASVPIDPSTGRYRAELSEPGQYRVQIDIGAARALERVEVPEQEVVERDFDIPINWIRGRVVDLDGNPVAGAEVSGSNAQLDLAETIRTFSVTRSDGSFHLKHLQPGLYTVTAGRRGYKRVTTEPMEVRPDTRIDGLELVLAEATLKVRGRLTDPGGNGIPDGFVIAAPTGTRRLELATHVPTRVDGTFEFDAPGDGPIDVTALSSDWAAVRVTGFMPDGESPLNLRAGFGGQVTIRVHDRVGSPREGVQLDVRAEPEWLASSTLAVLNVPPISGPDGIAIARNLPEGTYRISAPGGATAMVTVYDGRTAEVRLEVE